MRFGARIFGTVMIIIFVIVLIASFIANVFIVDSFFQNNEAIVMIQADLLARQVNNIIDKKQNLLILLGSFALTDYILALHGEDEKLIEEKIKEAEQSFQLFAGQEKSESFTELKFVDPQGDILIKILNGRIVDEKKENVSDEDYFSLMETWYEIDKEAMERLKENLDGEKLSALDKLSDNKFSIEEFQEKLIDMDFSEEERDLVEREAFISGNREKKYKYISPLFETEQGPAINIACLVEGFNGENIGIIIATYNLEDIHNIFNDVKFKKDWFAEDSFAWLVTMADDEPWLISFPQKMKYDTLMMDLLEKDGLYFLDYLKSSKGKYSCGKYFLENGEGRIIAFKPVSETLDWTVAISIPYRTFFSSAEELQSRLIAIVVALLLLLIILIFITFLYFLRPLTNLSSQISSLITEEKDKILDTPGNDELGDIGEAFNLLREKYSKFQHKEEEDRNPLTGLPGNIAVQKKLFDIIDSGDKFAVSMVDIDNFNVYNQRYSFTRGDSVIRMTSALVINMVKEYGNKDDFIGHLGGDDIVFLTTPDKVDEICNEIISLFDRQIPLYYNEEDREKDGFTWKDKKGAITRFPLMTLSIAVSTNEKRQIIHPLQISQIFSELLAYLKKQPGSKYFKDRRTHERKSEDKEESSEKDEKEKSHKDVEDVKEIEENKDTEKAD